ncbi:tubulin-specific chaperone A-like [Clytia hemisphaerica]|uniref:Tubulin-specific chaperone A n=1 Tax=Clytia hemisphaerica TaxID=252671 RepID=A0A7M5WID2_9CNID
MPPKDPKLRNITIKTGVVKRLAKEKTMYEKETAQQEAKIEKMKADGKDEYDIKKMIEVKGESAAMIMDCLNRLKKAHQELKTILDNDTDYAESEEYKAAQDVYSDASSVISA